MTEPEKPVPVWAMVLAFALLLAIPIVAGVVFAPKRLPINPRGSLEDPPAGELPPAKPGKRKMSEKTKAALKAARERKKAEKAGANG